MNVVQLSERGVGRLEPWILGKRPVDRLPDQVDHADPAHLVVVDESVRQVLASMSSRDRQVLVLNAWEGLSGDDLAAVLGISRGGADAALSRARARLREQWEKREAVEGR